MDNPAVSILIPTYNYARYLPEAIDSVLEQDFDDFELIIADDASTDHTSEICRAYVEKDPRVRFVRHEKNLGMVENWNWCLRQARGKYIKYLLADDKFSKPYALRCLLKSFDDNPGISLAVSARTLIDDSSQSIGVWGRLGFRNRVYDGQVLSERHLMRNLNLIGEPTAVLFRRRDAKRGFDCSFRQLVDLEMWLHLLQSGDLAYLSEPLCCFRQHVGQQTAVNRASGVHLRESIDLYDRYLSHSPKKMVIFNYIYNMAKSGRAEYRDLISENMARLLPTEYTVRYICYKGSRPFINAFRSVLKRFRKTRVF